MMDKAGKISQDLIENAPKVVQDDYNKDNETPAVKALISKIINEIKKKLEHDYVDSGILTKPSFDAEINKWINNIA